MKHPRFRKGGACVRTSRRWRDLVRLACSAETGGAVGQDPPSFSRAAYRSTRMRAPVDTHSQYEADEWQRPNQGGSPFEGCGGVDLESRAGLACRLERSGVEGWPEGCWGWRRDGAGLVRRNGGRRTTSHSKHRPGVAAREPNPGEGGFLRSGNAVGGGVAAAQPAAREANCRGGSPALSMAF